MQFLSCFFNIFTPLYISQPPTTANPKRDISVTKAIRIKKNIAKIKSISPIPSQIPVI